MVKQDSISMLVEADSRKEPLIIAVLPFVDLSANQDQEYLGDGIAEEIINGLTKISDLKVIGRTSSFSFKNQDLDLQAIAMKLGSNLMLEGSIRKAANKIRITAQLIDAKDGSHIWSENYDRNLDDIFIIQDDISARIAEKLRLSVKLSKTEAPPTKDFNAYELFLKGKYFHFQGLNGTLKARDLVEEAIERDPHFVDALILLSEIYWSISLYALGDRMENTRLAKKTILRAIELDSTNYDAYGYLGFLHLTTDWDWNEAMKNYHKAIELGLHLPDRNHLYYQAIIQGAGEEVIEGAKDLIKSDPLSVQFRTDLSRMYLFSHRYEDVIRHGHKTLELSPENTSILRHMGSAYLASGDMENALKYYGKLMLKDSTYAPHGYIAALVELDRKEEALNIFSKVSSSISPVKNAFSLMYLGELDSAFHYLDKAFVERDAYLSFIKIEPHFRPIQNDPRYLALVAKMKFPDIKPISK
jgi:TolB-like protein